MLKIDRDAVICDLAETYGIFDYRALPVDLLATLVIGLRDTSRIKMKMSGAQNAPDILLLAAAVDRLSFLVWAQTEDGINGVNKPKQLLDILLEKQNDRALVSFETAEEFEETRRRILEGVE